MNVKEIVKHAMDHIYDLFRDEKITNLGLEEVEFNTDIGEWEVTVGFSRPWDYPDATLTVLAAVRSVKRTYKIVTIKDANGEVISVKNRPFKD